MENVFVSDHPLVRHKLTLLRDKTTDSKQFRELVREITLLLCYEATRDLALVAKPVETPMGEAGGGELQEEIGLIPILRSGLGMVNGIWEMMPGAEVWHIGLYRDERTLRPVSYYNKLPIAPRVQVCLILDPMLATDRLSKCPPVGSGLGDELLELADLRDRDTALGAVVVVGWIVIAVALPSAVFGVETLVGVELCPEPEQAAAALERIRGCCLDVIGDGHGLAGLPSPVDAGAADAGLDDLSGGEPGFHHDLVTDAFAADDLERPGVGEGFVEPRDVAADLDVAQASSTGTAALLHQRCVKGLQQ